MFADQRGVLGKYHLIAEIARGGMGIVYLAMIQGKAGFSKLVVIKELKQDLVEDPQFLTMFMDEARLAARLSHPNIVQTHEVGSEGDRHFMVMEYLDGRTYERVRKRSKNSGNALTLHMQLRVMSDILGGLQYAHDLADFDGTPLSVVHRDVTPNNVFVTFDGQVKLLDFGIAKAADQSHETQAGVLKGKVAYMAPEQARGAKVDARADVFSVGVMMWEAIAGRRLRSGNAHEIVKALTDDVPRLSKDFPDVPDQLDEIVAKATVNDRDKRYQTAFALQMEIEDYLAKLGGTPQPRDVGTVMCDLFKDDRAKTSQLIEKYVARARAGAAVDEDLPVIEMASPVGLQTPLPTTGGNTGVDSSFGSFSQVQTPSAKNVESAGESIKSVLPVAPKSKKPVLIAGVVLAGGAIAAYALTRPPADPPPIAAQPAKPAPAPAAGNQPRAPEPPAPPAAPTIELAIEAKPATATITIDDAGVSSNPFHGKYRQDGVMHRIKVSAAGYESQVRDVAFDRDISLVLQLEKPVVVSARVAPPPRIVPKTVKKEPDPPKVVETPKQPDPPKKDPTQINPNGGQRPIRTIDPKNPYGGGT